MNANGVYPNKGKSENFFTRVFVMPLVVLILGAVIPAAVALLFMWIFGWSVESTLFAVAFATAWNLACGMLRTQRKLDDALRRESELRAAAESLVRQTNGRLSGMGYGEDSRN